MNPIETDVWFGGAKRPAWAGKVTIKLEAIHHVQYGQLIRTTEVIGLVAPGSTSGRPSAPEPGSGIRVSTAANVPARYQFDAQTGVNAYNTGFADAEKGHIMALELGGPDIPENIVPQWAKWQGSGVWRQKEREIQKLAEAGKPATSSSGGYYLMFHAVVRYPTDVKVEWAGLRRVCTPKGFTVTVTKLSKQGLSPLGAPIVVFDEDQARDQTDDMLAMRQFQQTDGSDMEYDDYTTGKKGKGRFVATGQDPRYAPPPIRSNATGFDLGAYMQEIGLQVGLNKNAQLGDDDDDEDYDDTDAMDIG